MHKNRKHYLLKLSPPPKENVRELKVHQNNLKRGCTALSKLTHTLPTYFLYLLKVGIVALSENDLCLKLKGNMSGVSNSVI